MGKSKDGNVTCFMYTQMRIVGLVKIGLGSSFDDDIRQAAVTARDRMKWKDHLREWGGAAVGVLPPTIAIVWMAHTGDFATWLATMDPSAPVTYITWIGTVKMPAAQAWYVAKAGEVASTTGGAAPPTLLARLLGDQALRKIIEPSVSRWINERTVAVEEVFVQFIAGLLLRAASETLFPMAGYDVRLSWSKGPEAEIPDSERSLLAFTVRGDALDVRIFNEKGEKEDIDDPKLKADVQRYLSERVKSVGEGSVELTELLKLVLLVGREVSNARNSGRLVSWD